MYLINEPFETLNRAGMWAIALAAAARHLPHSEVFAAIFMIAIFFYLKSCFERIKGKYYVAAHRRNILCGIHDAPLYFVGFTILFFAIVK